MYRKFGVVVLMAYMIGFLQARAQSISDSITLGTARLTLGMPKEAVLPILAKSYDLEKLNEREDSSSWLVTTGKGPESDIVGNSAFTSGKMTTIMKYWTPRDQQRGFEFATNLYGLVTSFTNEGRSMCSIETGRKEDPGVESKAIFITCGAKYIRIDITSGEKTGNTTGLAEVLEKKPIER